MGHKLRNRDDSNEDDQVRALRAADAAATRNATAPFRAPGQSGVAGGVTEQSISGKRRKKAKSMSKQMRKAAKRFAKEAANNGGTIDTAAMLEELRRIQSRGRNSTLLDPEVRTRNTHDAASPAALEKELSSLLLRKAVATGIEAAEIAGRLQQVGDELTLLKLRAFNSGLI